MKKYFRGLLTMPLLLGLVINVRFSGLDMIFPTEVYAAEAGGMTEDEIASLACTALQNAAAGKNMIIQNTTDSGSEPDHIVTTTLYYSDGKYYEVKLIEGPGSMKQESLFDGNTGWMKLTGMEDLWEESPLVQSTPIQISGLLGNADAFGTDSDRYENFAYKDGVISCQVTRTALDQMLENIISQMEMMLENYPEESRSVVQAEVDRYKNTTYDELLVTVTLNKETEVFEKFESVLNFTETIDGEIRTAANISNAEILEGDASEMVEEMLKQLSK